MRRISREYRHFFQECGRRGGLRRARRLSPVERSAIAAHAAQARWKRQAPSSTPMASVRLDRAGWEDPVYIEELVAEGSLADWKQIYRKISDEPFGSTARALERVLASTEVYGVNALWRGILSMLQGPVA